MLLKTTIATTLHATRHLAPAMNSPLCVGEEAFANLVTAGSLDAAAPIFARHGIVRVPDFLSGDEAAELVSAAEACGLRRDAYGQTSQLDRFTLWLAGDGMEGSAGAATATAAMAEQAPCAHRAFIDDGAESWRAIASQCGYSHMALAEVVTSLPGGSEQRWHFDGEGVTAQIALVRVGDAQGPTEVAPRALAREFVRNSEFVSSLSSSLAGGELGAPAAIDVLSRALRRLPDLARTAPQRPLYDLTTGAHAAAWAALRPLLGALDAPTRERVARQLIEAGLTPPVVRLTADVGCLTLYDSRMVHRGGRNVGETERPILAVHLRANGREYGMGE